jgi:hypothetical protein
VVAVDTIKCQRRPTRLMIVRYWPKADMPKNAIDVAFGGKADMPFCTAHVCF